MKDSSEKLVLSNVEESIGYITLNRPEHLSNVEESIGYITLNRPEHLNTFNLDLANQFLKAINLFNDDKTVRAIVIKGAGKIFSAGGDVKEMYNDVQEGKDRGAYFRSPLTTFNKMVLSLRDSPKPVLAAVQKAVAGVAFNLVLACDLRIAEEGTRFTQSFIKIGLSPDGGGTYFLPRLIGYARACELTMLPTEIDAETALNWGLINWIVPSDKFNDKVKKIAEGLAKGPALALHRTKSLLNQTYDHSFTEHIEVERLNQVKNSTSKDFEEGLKAFIEKRKPKFNHC